MTNVFAAAHRSVSPAPNDPPSFRMRDFRRLRQLAETARSFCILAALVLTAGISTLASAPPIQVAAGIDHTPFSELLQKHVDDGGLVDYGAWKRSDDDMKVLHTYLGKIAAKGDAAKGDDRKATLINAYNALTILTILKGYPIDSIHQLDQPFKKARHTVGGQMVSLDQIENENLRPLGDYRIHAALVCGARSCPPLRNPVFLADTLDEQLEDNMHQWLARSDLNKFNAKKRRAHISPIFKWFAEDFEMGGGLETVLTKYAPRGHRAFLRGKYKTKYLEYNWGLNDKGGRGAKYSKWQRLKDGARNL